MEAKQITLNQVYEKLVKLESYMKKLDNYIEDLEFARQTAEAWEEIEEGKGKTYTLEEFHEKLKI